VHGTLEKGIIKAPRQKFKSNLMAAIKIHVQQLPLANVLHIFKSHLITNELQKKKTWAYV
jgi:hypothetical protein